MNEEKALEKFEQETYQQEKNEFMSDKCRHCMHYVDEETKECKNEFCEKWMCYW